MSGWKRCWVVLTVLAVALGVRVGGAVWWQARLGDARALGMPDSDGYWELGHRIAAGQAYEYGGPDFRIFRTPGYPVLLAGLFTVVGADPPVLWARLVGALLGTVTVGVVIWMGRLLFDRDTGVLAGVLVAGYPGAVAMSLFVLAEALFCPLMMLHLACWVCAWQAVSRRREVLWSVLAGVAAACAVLARPSWLLFIPFVLGCQVLASPARWRHLRIGVWMLGALSLVMCPWWIRNYQVAGRFVPTTLQVGASLYDGLNPAATGASDMRFTTRYYQAQRQDDIAAGRSPDGFEVRLDRRMRDDAWSWARGHMGAAIRLSGAKFLRMWNIWPNAGEFQSRALRLVVAAGYVPLLVLGAIGVWRWVRRGWPYTLCVFPALYFTGLHVIFVASIRYRDPAMLVWAVLAAAVLAGVWRRRVAGRGEAVGVAV